MIYNRGVRQLRQLKLVKGLRSGCDHASSTVYRHELVRSLPVCNVETNLSAAAVPADFTRGLSKVLASTLNKPEDVSQSECSDVELVFIYIN